MYYIYGKILSVIIFVMISVYVLSLKPDLLNIINEWFVFGVFVLLVLLSGAALIHSALKPKNQTDKNN
ncbi:MAG: hypothetical protein B7X89_08935 [Sulfuricurvum sp. 17-40-25]|nr:MAG: hypothetical protein B7X89_08935 [Sulfuricurvum sp. 17-40-25]